MKKIYQFFIALLTVSASLKGQVTVTATGGAFSGAYPNLKAAFDAINNGDHQGAINIRINASTTELATATLNANGGTARYSRIHIRPTVACTISGDIAGPLIQLNGADSITFEGRIGGVGTERSLTIRNLNTGYSASTIRLFNTARANKLRYLNIEGAGQGDNAGAVIIGYGANWYNIIEYNDIGPAGAKPPCAGIQATPEGRLAGTSNSYNVIANNLVHDFFSTTYRPAGILMGASADHNTLSGNSIYYAAPVTGPAGSLLNGIAIDNGGKDTISNNFIGGSAPYAGGSPAVLNEGASVIGINVSSNLYETSIIEGNVIRNFKLSSSVQNRGLYFRGIVAYGIPVGKITGNTIGSLDKTDDITITYTGPATANTVLMGGIEAYGTTSGYGSLVIENNRVGGLTLNGAGAENARMDGINASTDNYTAIKNNTIGGPVPGSLQLNAASGTIDGILMSFQSYDRQYNCTQNTIRHLYNNCSGVTDAITRGITTTLLPGEGMTAICYITANRISHLHTTAPLASNGTVQGIFSSLYSTATKSYINNTISGNTIDTLYSESSGYASVVMGIGSQCPHNMYLDIDSNIIHTLRNAAANTNAISSAAVQGIGTNPPYPAPVSITRNRIYDLESTTAAGSTVIGINSAHKSNIYRYLLSKNQIYDLRNGQSEGGSVLGVSLRGSSGTGKFIITNNMISLYPERVTVYGIIHNATATEMQLYYNSIAIGGTAVGSKYSGAFYRTWGVNTNISARNNIFHNTRTGGDGRHYALRNDHAYPAAFWHNSDFNDLYSNNPKALVSWRVVSLSLSQYRDSSGQDLSSVSIPVDFTDSLSGDLHLLETDSNRQLAGIAIADVKDDFDGDPRHDHPAMGADEIEVLIPALARSLQALSHPAISDDDADKAPFLLYPNPTPDVLRINMKGINETIILTIFDVSGNTRMAQRLYVSDPGTSLINVQPLSAGTYLLQLSTSKGVITKRFVKM